MFMYLRERGQKNEYFCLLHICVFSHWLSDFCDSANSLVKIGKEVDSERMLFVEFVAICILHCLKSLSRSSVFQEDVPEDGNKGMF